MKFSLQRRKINGGTKGNISKKSIIYLFSTLLFLLSISAALAQSDAGVVRVSQPSGYFNSGQQQVWVTIRNFGPTTLTSLVVHWSIDGVVQTPFNWSGTLMPNDTANIMLGTYDFQDKSPMSPFRIMAWTTSPNGNNDNNFGNDSTYSYVAPYLSKTSYTIGGVNPDFMDLQSVNNYMIYAGINVSGNVTFNLRSGSYNGQMLFNRFNNDTNNVIFQSETNNPTGVVLNYTVSNMDSNYILRFNGSRNITIRYVTFNVRDSLTGSSEGGPQRTGGHIIDIENNSSNISITNNIFNGVTNAPKTADYAIIYARNNRYSVHNISNNIFNYGSAAIYEQEDSIKTLRLNAVSNSISSYSWVGIRTIGIDSAFIRNNTISGGAGQAGNNAASYGIWSSEDTHISGNMISGLMGSGMDSSEAAIKVVHNIGMNSDSIVTPNIDTVYIQNNQIVNCINVNGIYVQAPNVDIRNNTITVNSMDTASSRAGIILVNSGSTGNPARVVRNNISAINSYGIELIYSNAKVYFNLIRAPRDTGSIAAGINARNAGLYAIGSQGYVANNIIYGRGSTGVSVNNSFNLSFYYNTIISRARLYPALRIIAGINNLFRNIIMNLDSGLVFDGLDIENPLFRSNENNMYTAGGVFAMYNRNPYARFSQYQSASLSDGSSVSMAVPFAGEEDFELIMAMDNLFSRIPLSFSDSTLNTEIQMFDYDSTLRKLYYYGAFTINPTVTVIGMSPKALIDCAGSTGHVFTVTTQGLETTPMVQWMKDSTPIEGATSPVFNLDTLTFAKSGLYWALVWGTGGADTVSTDTVLVYALSKTEIIDSVRSQTAPLGGRVQFEVNVHAAEFIKDSVQNYVQFQWYKGNTPLTDNNRVAGSHSSILSIINVQPTDYDSSYRVIVTSMCGSDSSNIFTINRPPAIQITLQPVDVTICQGDTARFNIGATVMNSTDSNLTYQWMFNGGMINDTSNRLSGIDSTVFSIPNVTPSDTGYYTVIVRMRNNQQVVDTSLRARLIVNTRPVISGRLNSAMTVNQGDSLRLMLPAATGTTPITYQWYFNGAPLTGMTDTSFFISAVDTTQGGRYYLTATNACGVTYSDTLVLTVTPRTPQGIADGDPQDMNLLQNIPNPFTDVTTISYMMSSTGIVKLVVTDVYGQEVAVLDQGSADPGLHNIVFNARDFMLSSGVYNYTLISGTKMLSGRMVIVR